MPAQLAGQRIEVQQISDLRLGVFVQELTAAMLLGDLEGLIGIDLEEVQIPGLGGTISGSGRRRTPGGRRNGPAELAQRDWAEH